MEQNLSASLSALTITPVEEQLENGTRVTVTLPMTSIAEAVVNAVCRTLTDCSDIIDPFLKAIDPDAPNSAMLSMVLMAAYRQVEPQLETLGDLVITSSYTTTDGILTNTITAELSDGGFRLEMTQSDSKVHIVLTVNGSTLSMDAETRPDGMSFALTADSNPVIRFDLAAAGNTMTLTGSILGTSIDGRAALTDTDLTVELAIGQNVLRAVLKPIFAAGGAEGANLSVTIDDITLIEGSAHWDSNRGSFSMVVGSAIFSGSYSRNDPGSFQLDANLNGLPVHFSIDLPAARQQRMYIPLSELISRAFDPISNSSMSCQIGNAEFSLHTVLGTKYQYQLHMAWKDAFTLDAEKTYPDGNFHAAFDIRSAFTLFLMLRFNMPSIQPGTYTLDITADNIRFSSIDYYRMRFTRNQIADVTAQYPDCVNATAYSESYYHKRNGWEVRTSTLILTKAAENGYVITIADNTDGNPKALYTAEIDLQPAPAEVPTDVQYVTQEQLTNLLQSLLP